MSDTSTNSPAAGSPEGGCDDDVGVVVSSNSVAFKIGRNMSWQVIRDNGGCVRDVSRSPA